MTLVALYILVIFCLYGVNFTVLFFPIFTYYMHFLCIFVNLWVVDLVHYDRVERPQDYINCIIDLREYDVPYHVRFATDNGEA